MIAMIFSSQAPRKTACRNAFTGKRETAFLGAFLFSDAEQLTISMNASKIPVFLGRKTLSGDANSTTFSAYFSR